jgi:hypothetical protein
MNTTIQPETRVEKINAVTNLQARLEAGRISWSQVWIMLVARTVLFAVFQALIALDFWIWGTDDSWNASVAYWPVTITLTNLVCLGFLDRLTRREGIRLFELITFERRHFVLDLLTAVAVLVICTPLVLFPNYALSLWLFGDINTPSAIFFRPLPYGVALACLVLFPLTVALAELPTYFAYVMPRLAALSRRPWLAWLLTSLWLGLQHATLPLVFDWRFVIWRALMFMPFALFLGACLLWRPRLLPYLMVGHGLLDFVTMWMIFTLRPT